MYNIGQRQCYLNIFGMKQRGAVLGSTTGQCRPENTLGKELSTPEKFTGTDIVWPEVTAFVGIILGTRI